MRTNKWWDRVEVRTLLYLLLMRLTRPSISQKVIYLTIDMSLNSYFILTVKRRLVSYGVCDTLLPIFPCR